VQDVADPNFETVEPGVLTVATTLPAPGFWTGTGAAPDGGFEWAIASELASELDLDLRVVDVPFDRIASGDLGGADLAMSQISTTDERREVLDFSVGYYDTDSGVVGRAGEEISDLKTAGERRWAVLGGTTHEAFIREVVRPDEPLLVLDDNVAVAQAVANGDVDVGLFDLTTALALTNEVEGLDTLAQFDTDEHYAIALPRSSPNVEMVDSVLRELEADGTIASYVDEWLAPVLGRDPSDVPTIIARNQ
jgi:polar amino acid transport system substrate-binding protein